MVAMLFKEQGTKAPRPVYILPTMSLFFYFSGGIWGCTSLIFQNVCDEYCLCSTFDTVQIYDGCDLCVVI